MKRCTYCLKPIGLVEYKRWGKLYFCSKAHLQSYCKQLQQENQELSNFVIWLRAQVMGKVAAYL
jgi:hypothetical protein